METSGIWVRFKQPNGRPDEETKWLSIGRTWFIELRAELKGAWRAQYGERVPASAVPRNWVASELEKMGVRLNGKETVHLPYALYLKVWVAKEGDGKGPKGEWEVFETILPGRRPRGPVSMGRRT